MIGEQSTAHTIKRDGRGVGKMPCPFSGSWLTPQEGMMADEYVIARCFNCGTKRKVYAGEVAPGNMPMCQEPGCFGCCVAISAEATP